MLSTITLRSALAGSRSTRIEGVGLLACMVEQALRNRARTGIRKTFMETFYKALLDPS
jgi:hypothetical protein